MVGGSLRVLWLPSPPKLVILLYWPSDNKFKFYMCINEKQSRKKTQLYSVSYGTKIKKDKK
jgi:hypothetical protein